MGQYYKACNLTKKECISPFGGVKLMEHSWIGNDTMGAVMDLLSKGGKWEGDRIAWVGDYTDDTDNARFASAYNFPEISPQKPYMNKEDQRKSIVVNHTKKQYFVLNKTPREQDGWQINALSLLTATSNGQGGGDYRGVNDDKCGVWVGDSISIMKTIPTGYQEFFVKWVENEMVTPKPTKPRVQKLRKDEVVTNKGIKRTTSKIQQAKKLMTALNKLDAQYLTGYPKPLTSVDYKEKRALLEKKFIKLKEGMK